VSPNSPRLDWLGLPGTGTVAYGRTHSSLSVWLYRYRTVAYFLYFLSAFSRCLLPVRTEECTEYGVGYSVRRSTVLRTPYGVLRSTYSILNYQHKVYLPEATSTVPRYTIPSTVPGACLISFQSQSHETPQKTFWVKIIFLSETSESVMTLSKPAPNGEMATVYELQFDLSRDVGLDHAPRQLFRFKINSST
jgi:hypothetical protein